MPETKKIKCGLRRYSSVVASAMSTDCFHSPVNGRAPCGNCNFATTKFEGMVKHNITLKRVNFPGSHIYTPYSVNPNCLVIIRKSYRNQYPVGLPVVLRMDNGLLTEPNTLL